jgi:hypothetical protein
MYSDSDPDPALFVSDVQEANKNSIFSTFCGLLLFEGTFTLIFKDTVKSYKKKSQNSRNQGFLATLAR